MKIRDLKNSKYHGGIALTVVIIVSGILLLSGINIVLSAVDLRNSSVTYTDILNAKIQARSCVEESVQRMKFDTDYTGTITLSFDTGDCTAIVTNGSPSNIKNVSIESTSGQSIYEEEVQIDTSEYPFVIL